MSKQSVEMVTEEIWKILRYAQLEYEMNLSEMVGALEIIKLTIVDNSFQELSATDAETDVEE